MMSSLQANTRVLVADDDPTVCLLMQAALEGQGFSVLLANDGTQAMALFESERPDLVVLDVEMPGFSGYEVCRQIRQLMGQDVPVVLVTGHDDMQSVDMAYQSGATDFISKPINWTLIGHRMLYIKRAYDTVQALHHAQTHRQAMLKALPDLLLRVNVEGDLLESHGHMTASMRQVLNEIALRSRDAVRHALTTGQTQRLDYVFATDDAQGDKQFYEGRVTPIGTDEALCLVRDTTDRHAAVQKIRQLAYFDAVTGLPNRLNFQEHVERESGRARREGLRMAVLVFDLDGLKRINDSLGFDKGDMLLQRVAERLRSELRPSDILGRRKSETTNEHDDGHLARLGGGEFTILLARIDIPDDALIVANRIRQLVARPLMIDGHEIVITASVGIGIYPNDTENTESLVTYADTAMYSAKEQGRDTCQFYNSSLTAHAVARLSIQSALHQALEREEFHLLYQPLVHARTGRIIAVEALIRWQHPERGLIPPMEFIPLAEELGLILRIGDWVIRTACADAMRWRQMNLPRIQMSVNLSNIQFRNKDLLKDISHVLEQTGLPADCLELEITESALMEDAQGALAQMSALKKYSVKMALDDFGTGYSSLQYLKELPLSKLKIDRAFVTDLCSDSKSDEAIVRAVVSLARTLGMQVTAEGVETLDQANALVALGCDSLQGYYFSKPVFADAIPELMNRTWVLGSSPQST